MNSNNMLIDYDIAKSVGQSLVTGGAGFIGSHIADFLTQNKVNVKVLDNLSAGNASNMSKSNSTKLLHFIKGDLKNSDDIKLALHETKTVFHMAADPEVRGGFKNPDVAYDQNIGNTFHLLEGIRKSKTELIVFASSSTIYGEPNLIPTPENYGPLKPISIYGASKLACEALISSYCYNYGLKVLIFRMANVIGSRSKHGVILDFINKLTTNPHKLEILGNGNQSKSYIHVSDCVKGFFTALSKSREKVDIFNVGNDDKIDVMSIAQIVCSNMGYKDTEFITTDKNMDGRGWVGDVKTMQLDVSKLKEVGWTPNLSSAQSVDVSCKELLQELSND